MVVCPCIPVTLEEHTNSNSRSLKNNKMTSDSSPEFSPSILHNKKGPLNPSYHRNPTVILPTDTALTPYVPQSVDRFLKDKRTLAVLCLLIPPFAVFLKTGLSRKFALCLLLYFFIFPGIVYGFYVTFLESALNPSSENYEV